MDFGYNVGINFQTSNRRDIQVLTHSFLDETTPKRRFEELRLVAGPDNPNGSRKDYQEKRDDSDDDESITETAKLLNVQGGRESNQKFAR